MSEFIILFFEDKRLYTTFIKAETLEEARDCFRNICDGEITHIQYTNQDEYNTNFLIQLLNN